VYSPKDVLFEGLGDQNIVPGSKPPKTKPPKHPKYTWLGNFKPKVRKIEIVISLTE